jgi:DNA-binding transcriptional MocR family regulator
MSLACPWDPPDGGDARVLAETLQAIAQSDASDLLLYDAESAPLRHRVVAAEWISGMGVPVSPERVVVTVGAQHALTLILSTLLRPGDTLLAAELTYPALKAVAQMLGIRVRSLALDEEGITPDSLDRACAEGGAKALYCVPRLRIRHRERCHRRAGRPLLLRRAGTT